MNEHNAWTQVPNGGWVPAIPIAATGLLGWRVRRACRKNGGHFFHSDRRWGWACCGCGYRTENPVLPGVLCSPQGGTDG